LIYQGQDDLVIPTGGMYNLVNNIEWTGQLGFKLAKKELWKKLDGKLLGSIK